MSTFKAIVIDNTTPSRRWCVEDMQRLRHIIEDGGFILEYGLYVTIDLDTMSVVTVMRGIDWSREPDFTTITYIADGQVVGIDRIPKYHPDPIPTSSKCSSCGVEWHESRFNPGTCGQCGGSR